MSVGIEKRGRRPAAVYSEMIPHEAVRTGGYSPLWAAFSDKTGQKTFRPQHHTIERGIRMIAIIDYDAGNLRSVEKALACLGETPVITRNREEILKADRVILPGVGAFGDAMRRLRQYGLVDVIREAVDRGTPFLGICLGLQLMFESSEESPGEEGLGLLPGKILKIPSGDGLKIPHMGWNSLEISPDAALFKGIENGSYVYFVHSFYLKAEDPSIVAAGTEYGTYIHASVEKGNLFACQFHPEKSSRTGLAILKNFIELPAVKGGGC